LKKEIGKRLRTFRKHLGYTQEKLAAFLSVTRADISSIEKGQIFPSLDMLQSLNKELNLSLHWLLFNEGEMIKTVRRENKVHCPQSEEMEDLLWHLENVPAVRQAVLTFYFDYKANFWDIIHELLKSSEPPLRSKKEPQKLFI
jgi:transcriptional regulator with XRE-family HTH domain